MADITQTIQDGLGLSAGYEPDGIIRPPIVEDLNLTLQVIPSGYQKSAEENMTLTEVVVPSGYQYSVNDDNLFFSESIPSTSGHLNQVNEDVNLNSFFDDGVANDFEENENISFPSISWDQEDDISLLSPTPSSVYPSHFSIPFQCSATYGEGGTVEDANIIWISDLDGAFHRGANFTYKGLSVGDHLITVSVQDNAMVYVEFEISIIENDVDDRVEGLREE